MLCLKRPTDEAWAAHAVEHANAVLLDHAHCEMKAASNARSLVARYGDDPFLSRTMTDLAREEAEHFDAVVALLSSRGVVLGPPPVDWYAAELRRRVRDLPQRRSNPLVDRLLVAALIEARSCERFKLLARATAGDEDRATEHALWRGLLASEARHYRTFVGLAARFAGGDVERVGARLEAAAEIEADVVAAAARRPTCMRAAIHG